MTQREQNRKRYADVARLVDDLRDAGLSPSVMWLEDLETGERQGRDPYRDELSLLLTTQGETVAALQDQLDALRPLAARGIRAASYRLNLVSLDLCVTRAEMGRTRARLEGVESSHGPSNTVRTFQPWNKTGSANGD